MVIKIVQFLLILLAIIIGGSGQLIPPRVSKPAATFARWARILSPPCFLPRRRLLHRRRRRLLLLLRNLGFELFAIRRQTLHGRPRLNNWNENERTPPRVKTAGFFQMLAGAQRRLLRIWRERREITLDAVSPT